MEQETKRLIREGSYSTRESFLSRTQEVMAKYKKVELVNGPHPLIQPSLTTARGALSPGPTQKIGRGSDFLGGAWGRG